MRIGLTYTPRSTAPQAEINGSALDHCAGDLLDDAEEEFDSPTTIAAIADALKSLGHEVELLCDGPQLVDRLLRGTRPDLVFNIAEGRGISRSREAWVPALLEMFSIPYTGSDPLTLAATLDKHCAKQLVRQAGVATPEGLLVDGPCDEFAHQLAILQRPLIVKPAFEGSSKGIGNFSLVTKQANLAAAISRCRGNYQQPVLVEEFIDGEELTVGICGNAPPELLGIMRVVPLSANGPFVYSLEVKRDWRRQVRYESPAMLTREVEVDVRQAALTACKALGCRDVCRIDFRLRGGIPYFLEANPLPGLSPGTSDLVLLAEGVGIGYRELLARILDAALARQELVRPAGAAMVGSS